MGLEDRLRIWAPRASRLDIIVGETVIPATSQPDGSWLGPALTPGTDYVLSVNGGPPCPDPRSRWQPAGVHGPSRALDPLELGSPPCARQTPLGAAVIYELHIGTFSEAGTFEGSIPHLDHLVELGVTHVELLPVAAFPGRHGWGYDGVDLFAVHEPYGGPAGLRALISACHERGLAVLIDVVHNHFGPEGSYVDALAPYHTDAHPTPWGPAINLDREGSGEVRAYMIDSALAWLRDYGADGLRLDALHALRDDSPTHFVAELTDAVRDLERELGRPLTLIGEWDEHDPHAVRARGEGGWGLDAHWNDDFHHAVHALVTGEVGGYYADFAEPATLARILHGGYALDGGFSPFRGKPHGKPFGELSRDRLVAYVQSHDQIGNRSGGERLSHLAGIDRAKVAAALLLLSPMVPMLFQGEEWAASTRFYYFTDLGTDELRRAVRDGRRREHGLTGWSEHDRDPTDPGTRDASVLRWDERTSGEHADMLAWYRALIALRREHSSLREAGQRSTAVEIADGVIEIQRGAFRLLTNLSDRPRPLTGAVVLQSRPLDGNSLRPGSCAVVRR